MFQLGGLVKEPIFLSSQAGLLAPPPGAKREKMGGI